MADEASVVVLKPQNIENPFTSEGILSQKADYIITHSTITRTELQIADPDNIEPPTTNNHNQPEIVEDQLQQLTPQTIQQSPQVKMGSPQKEVRLESIEVEVGQASMVEPMRAQEVQLKKKKMKFCCSS